MSTHTLGPWFQGQIKGTEHQIFTSEVGVFIDDAEANPADIAFIVRACNSHEVMLESLIQAQSVLGDLVRAGGASIDEIEAYSGVKEAIRLAEGRA